MDAAMQSYDEDREFWEENTDSYEFFLKLFGGPFAEVRERLRERIGGDDRVLEVAAGTGELTTAMVSEAGRLVATDYADAMVATLEERLDASSRSDVECERADIYELPYDEASFDVVVAGNVLHLLPDLSGAVDELSRVLESGGTLITPTFVHDETWLGWATSRALDLAGGPGDEHYDVESFREALEREGLELERVETISGIMPLAHVESTPSAT